MPKSLLVLLALAALHLPSSALAELPSPTGPDVLYQVSTIEALLDGQYDGQATLSQLAEHGDLGLGTFNGLDGEMIVLDGRFFQVRADGKAYAASPETRTPFAAVTRFQPKETYTLTDVASLDDLQQRLLEKLPGPNIFYALRVTGEFAYAKTRSVPRQTKPYPPLADVTKTQPTFEFHDTAGTLVGFYCPAFAGKLNVPGFHLHLLTQDETAGGHLLNLRAAKLNVAVDATPGFFLALPAGEAFQQVDLGKDRSQELKRVEE